jgi:hypothetical protein
VIHDAKPRKLRGLDRDVELRAVGDVVEHDPVSVREPLVGVARGGRRPGQQHVLGPPHDPDRAADRGGVDAPVLASRLVEEARIGAGDRA